MYFAGLFPRTLSPAFRRDATCFPERNARVADVQWALTNDDAPVRGAGRVRRLVCTPVRPSVSRDTPRRARVHPETGLEVPVFFLTTQFLYGTTFAGTAQPFVLDTWSIITGWRKISGALIGHSPWSENRGCQLHISAAERMRFVAGDLVRSSRMVRAKARCRKRVWQRRYITFGTDDRALVEQSSTV